MATKQTLIALAFSVALATAAQAECLTDAQAAAKARRLLIEFADGTVPVRPDADPHGSLF